MNDDDDGVSLMFCRLNIYIYIYIYIYMCDFQILAKKKNMMDTFKFTY